MDPRNILEILDYQPWHIEMLALDVDDQVKIAFGRPVIQARILGDVRDP